MTCAVDSFAKMMNSKGEETRVNLSSANDAHSYEAIFKKDGNKSFVVSSDCSDYISDLLHEDDEKQFLVGTTADMDKEDLAEILRYFEKNYSSQESTSAEKFVSDSLENGRTKAGTDVHQGNYILSHWLLHLGVEKHVTEAILSNRKEELKYWPQIMNAEQYARDCSMQPSDLTTVDAIGQVGLLRHEKFRRLLVEAEVTGDLMSKHYIPKVGDGTLYWSENFNMRHASAYSEPFREVASASLKNLFTDKKYILDSSSLLPLRRNKNKKMVSRKRLSPADIIKLATENVILGPALKPSYTDININPDTFQRRQQQKEKEKDSTSNSSDNNSKGDSCDTHLDIYPNTDAVGVREVQGVPVSLSNDGLVDADIVVDDDVDTTTCFSRLPSEEYNDDDDEDRDKEDEEYEEDDDVMDTSAEQEKEGREGSLSVSKKKRPYGDISLNHTNDEEQPELEVHVTKRALNSSSNSNSNNDGSHSSANAGHYLSSADRTNDSAGHIDNDSDSDTYSDDEESSAKVCMSDPI